MLTVSVSGIEERQCRPQIGRTFQVRLSILSYDLGEHFCAFPSHAVDNAMTAARSWSVNGIPCSVRLVRKQSCSGGEKPCGLSAGTT